MLVQPGGALSRAQLIALGRQGGAGVWRFAPLAEAALGSFPVDHELRLVLIAAYGRLGLRTAALEHLERLGSSGLEGGAGRVAASGPVELHRAVTALDSDEVSIEACLERIQKGMEALRARGINLSGQLEAWEAARRAQQWFQTKSGNVVRRAGPGAWIRFADEMGAAMAHLPMLPPVRPGEKPAPVYLEGVDPPWLLLRLLAERPVQPDGYQPRILVVVEEGGALLDAMACRDLSPVLAQERVEVVVGPGAAGELERRLGARLSTQLGTTCLQLPGGAGAGRSPDGPGSVRDTLMKALERQREEGAAAIDRAMREYATRDAAWWARRYREALAPGSDRPLRVLIPTSRYSTYIQHASADIASAFRAAGCEARVLIEPDDSSTMIGYSYAKAFNELEPDLVLMINYPRRHLAGVIPEQVPHVCWVQDAMGHLFDPGTGGLQGPLDLLVGHLLPELMASVSGSRRRAMALPVLASRAKFHAGPVSDDLQREHECEIAVITHQSQSPESYRQQLLGQVGSNTPMAELLADLYPEVARLAARAIEEDFSIGMRSAVERAMQARGMPLAEGTIGRVLNQMCRPLADRMLRHEAVGWAAGIARERGWRFHLYGRGWASHPEFGRFAKGELEHGDSLRAAYGCARVTLHVSISWNLHQRVTECALSGGLPLCRLKLEDLASLEAHTTAAIADRVGRERGLACGNVEWPTADAPETMRLVSCLQQLGAVDRIIQGARRMDPGSFFVPSALIADPWWYWDHSPFPLDLAWLHGDPCESMFWSRESLEAAVVKAVTMPRWRDEVSRGIARRAGAWLTYEGAAPRIGAKLLRQFEDSVTEGSG